MELPNVKPNNMHRRLRTKLQDAFDVNYSVAQVKIDTFEDFEKELLMPFSRSSGIFYRGERICSPSRRLLPTFLRKEAMDSDELYSHIDSNVLYNFYTKKKHSLTFTLHCTAHPTPKSSTKCSLLHSITLM